MRHLRFGVVGADLVQLLLQGTIFTDQRAGGVEIGFNFVKPVGFKPLRTNAFDQPRNIALRPQQLPLFVVNQGQGGALLIKVFRHFDGDSVIFPFRQGIKQIAFAA